MPIQILLEAGSSGTIRAHFFENAAAGVKRGLYWSVASPRAFIHIGKEKLETSLSCEWMDWPLKDWTQLDGAGLEWTINAGLIECSFYIGEHYEATLTALTLRRIAATSRFVVAMAGEVEIKGFRTFDRKTTFSLEFGAFTEVILVPDNLFPKPASEREATAALAPFISIANLDAARWDRFRYVFSPVTQPG